MSYGSKPDIIVGIDFGQTCTGVAYNVVSHGSDVIRWIQKWPGRANANENKVPSLLVYPHGHDRPSSWGFKAETQTEQNPEHGMVKEWFKTQLDPANLERYKSRVPDDPVTHDDVRRWFRDYLGLLYESIKTKMSAELPHGDWSAAKVEFLFSVPTTWNPQTVEEYRSIIGQAGFGGSVNADHLVTISLTEPEAAAVHTSTAAAGIFKPDEVIVVCDAGGGTTDLSAMRVTDTAVGSLSLKQLKQLDVVEGENIGSAAIDFEFERLVKKRLEEADHVLPLGFDIDEAAWEMAKGSDYQNTKCEHGADDDAPTFTVAVPALRHRLEYENQTARISYGEMKFDRAELRELFDRQIEKLFKLIDGQLTSLGRKVPDEQVNHLVLSGGLGQSAYVQQRLRDRYGQGCCEHPNALSMQVRVAPDPQLAVCEGLVADRLRKLKAGEGVMGWRCCRASYGLICRELYDRSNQRHIGRPAEKDKRDGKLYVPDCVDWFIEKGNPVSIDKPIIHQFRRKMAPGDPKRIFPTKVVVSYNDKNNLPYCMDHGVERLCDIVSDLTGADESQFKERNKQFWKPGERYYEVTYEVRVLIGPADLRFELWFDGQKMSRDSSIKVEWAPSTAPSTAALEVPPRPPVTDDSDKLPGRKPSTFFKMMQR